MHQKCLYMFTSSTYLKLVHFNIKVNGEVLGLIHVCELDPWCFVCIYDFILDLLCVFVIYCVVCINLSSVPYVVFVVPFVVLSSDSVMAPATLSFDLLAPPRRKGKEVRRRRWLWR